ncbi:hypothetical protein AN958_07258 [Leucoagaricus sp. SymC.cos]|nr:hypothetical protein AN958_07258 [Leucoagaricus sp. SymC.cos]
MDSPHRLQNSSAPAENWDDDFDFHSQSGSPKRQPPPHPHRSTTQDSIRSSIATEDWDADNASSIITTQQPPAITRHSNVLADRPINIAAANLSNWAETDPSTPQKASFSVDPSAETENWDDDFLDKTDSPARRSTRANNTPSKHSISGKLRAGIPLNHQHHHNHHKPPRQDEEEEYESWDDEFDFNNSPIKPSKSSTPGKSRRVHTRHSEPRSSFSLNHPDSSDDEDDFGVASAEEDRTVTARSRRAPQAHNTPPPPLPSIPFTLIPLSTTTTRSSPHVTPHLNPPSTTTPFPCSPTTSVFSVPGSLSIAETTSLRSTAPLRPSLSRNPNANALKYLPPSPPIHRERRRLRKKSRPPPQGVVELIDMGHHHQHHQYPLSDTDADPRYLDVLDEQDRMRTPSPAPPPIPEPDVITTSASVPPTPSRSHATSAGGAFLTKIGSVKRWTSRKKKGSSEEKEKKGGSSSGKDLETHPTPRPRTSLSSLLHPSSSNPPQPQPPPATSSWFFRPSSPTTSRSNKRPPSSSKPRTSHTGSRSGSMTDLSMRGSLYASSSSNYEIDGENDKMRNKLAKRKSLGFVQIRKGLLANTSGSGSEPSGFGGKVFERERGPGGGGKRPMSMQGPRIPSTMVRPTQTQRHASYGTSPKPTAPSMDDLHESAPVLEPIARERKRSVVRPKARVVSREAAKEVTKLDERDNSKPAEAEKEEVKPKEKDEGMRGFMGSMRRLSLVGRHRRNRSSASSVVNMDFTGVAGQSRTSIDVLSSTPASATMMVISDGPPLLPPLPPMEEMKIPRPKTPRTPTAPTVPRSSSSGGIAVPLLPPIELQPPSPPRKNAASAENADSAATGGNSNLDSLLSPVSNMSASESVGPPTSASTSSFASTSASASSSTSPLPLSSPSPKSPSADQLHSSTALRSPTSALTSPSKIPRTPKRTITATSSPPIPPSSTASLGRSTISPKRSGISGLVAPGIGQHESAAAAMFPRRNSLSDLKLGSHGGAGGELKIPARISQAQQGLKRDLGMVRDFAVYIEHLKKQQDAYYELVQEMQKKLDELARNAQLSKPPATSSASSSSQQQQQRPSTSSSRVVSPHFFNFNHHLMKPKPKSRARSNTNPGTRSGNAIGGDNAECGSRYKDLAAAFYTINSKYRISWECAELLVDLADGTGASAAATSTGGEVGRGAGTPASVSAPVGLSIGGGEAKRGRERAITLAGTGAGEDSKPPTPTPGMSNSMINSSTSLLSQSRPGSGSGSGSGGGPPAASPAAAWRASTGRHDLSHRQLVLLREMLNNAEAVLSADYIGGNDGGFPSSVPEETILPRPLGAMSTESLKVNREWRWGGDPMGSTITLPSGEDRVDGVDGETEERKKHVKKERRKSKLVGMAGIRDMLRALKRNVADLNRVSTEGQQLSTASATTTTTANVNAHLQVKHDHAMLSTASFNTDTSNDQSSASHQPSLPVPMPVTSSGRRRARTSTGPETVGKVGKEREKNRDPREPSPSPSPSPYTQNQHIPVPPKSPRRPSLSSIFRLGSRKHTPPSMSATDLSLHGGSDSAFTDASSSRPGTNLARGDTASPQLEFEDWDRIDSKEDLPRSKNGKGVTMKLKKGGEKSPYLQYHATPASSTTNLQARPATPRRSASGSQLSLWAESPLKTKPPGIVNHYHHHLPLHLQQATPRASRLSNVDENTEGRERRRSSSRSRVPSSSATTSMSKLQKSGSVRSMPPRPIFSEASSRLAMTPENIKPLLENAKEVHARLGDCLMEIRTLLESGSEHGGLGVAGGLAAGGERSVSGSSCATSTSASVSVSGRSFG